MCLNQIGFHQVGRNLMQKSFRDTGFFGQTPRGHGQLNGMQTQLNHDPYGVIYPATDLKHSYC
jgi:hypothetical protein